MFRVEIRDRKTVVFMGTADDCVTNLNLSAKFPEPTARRYMMRVAQSAKRFGYRVARENPEQFLRDCAAVGLLRIQLLH